MLLQGPGQILTFERSTDIISPSYSKICFTVAAVAAVAALAVVVIILLLLAFRLAVGWLAGLLACWLAGWLVGWLALNLFGGQVIFLFVSSIFIE